MWYSNLSDNGNYCGLITVNTYNIAALSNYCNVSPVKEFVFFITSSISIKIHLHILWAIVWYWEKDKM